MLKEVLKALLAALEGAARPQPVPVPVPVRSADGRRVPPSRPAR
jgi:hypothetical protein